MLIDLKAFNKSNPLILLDFRWGEGPGSGLVGGFNFTKKTHPLKLQS
jgi:hypothetical protein